MTQGLPDWMFAAFAIGGWELFDLISRHFGRPHLRYVGGGIVVICMLVLGIRYLMRWVKRPRHRAPEDPDEWKQY